MPGQRVRLGLAANTRPKRGAPCACLNWPRHVLSGLPPPAADPQAPRRRMPTQSARAIGSDVCRRTAHAAHQLRGLPGIVRNAQRHRPGSRCAQHRDRCPVLRSAAALDLPRLRPSGVGIDKLADGPAGRRRHCSRSVVLFVQKERASVGRLRLQAPQATTAAPVPRSRPTESLCTTLSWTPPASHQRVRMGCHGTLRQFPTPPTFYLSQNCCGPIWTIAPVSHHTTGARA